MDETEVTFGNNEFVSDEYDIIRGDLYLEISNMLEKSYHYHIELQTKNDATMVIRMFEYGFRKAKELSKYKSSDETIIYIPKQLVIFIEQNTNIKNELKMRLIFPDGQNIYYTVPIMKYWEYDSKTIIEEKIYPLLPLQVFKLRYKLENLKKSGKVHQPELTKTILEAKSVAETIAKEGKRLYELEEINGDDLHKILLAIATLFEYLNRKYGDDQKLEEEVFAMAKILYDPIVHAKAISQGKMQGRIEGKIEGKLEVAKKLILLGIDMDKIVEATDIPKEEIEKLMH